MAALGATLVAGAIAGCTGPAPKQSTSKARPFTASDMPVKVGLTRQFLSNDPAINRYVPVDFNFDGPWDFSEGPLDSLVVTKIVGKRRAFDASKFSKATIAMTTAIKGKEKLGTTSYFSKSEKAYLTYGQAGRQPGTNVFEKPEAVLKFPLEEGVEWRDRIMLKSTPPTELDVTRRVVGQGTVTVPAGEFNDSVMVQVSKTLRETDGTATSSIGYEWYAPGIGIVAWVAGRSNEPEPLFKEATFFQRLKSYTK